MPLQIPDKYRPYIRIGTCSWKFESWKGLYYEPGKKYRSFDYLPDYANHLDSVEVDQWFWSLFPGGVKLPDIRTVKTYAESVPDDFVFTVKAPNSLTLTHFYSKQPVKYSEFAGTPNPHFLDNDLLEKFLETLSPMGQKLGPIMFQFEYLNRKKMPSKEAFFECFQDFITRAPKGYQYAVETRNPNYISPAFFQFLEENNLGFVYLEGYYMPRIGSIFDRYKPVTADFSIIRLHGGDRLEMEMKTGEVWNRLVSPQPQGLEAAARIVRLNLEKEVITFLNVNNHFEGSAPLTIERFLDVLHKDGVRL